MVDRITKETRSDIMRRVKSKGNISTEKRFRGALVGHGITGWVLHPDIKYHPDFYFKERKVMVYIDGCFWHGCKKCKKMPSSNTVYWLKKISSNRARDREAVKQYRNLGYTVLRFWEHDVRDNLDRCIDKVKAALFPMNVD